MEGRATNYGSFGKTPAPAPHKRKKRSARRGADADTDTDAEVTTVVAAAAATHGGAEGSDDAESDGTKTGPVDKQATMKNAKSTHGKEEEDSAY